MAAASYESKTDAYARIKAQRAKSKRQRERGEFLENVGLGGLSGIIGALDFQEDIAEDRDLLASIKRLGKGEKMQGHSHPDWPLVAECSTERAMPDWRTVLPDDNARGYGSEKSSRVYESIQISAKVAEHWPDQWLREGFRRIEQTHHGARWRIFDVPLYVNYRSDDVV